MLTKLDELLRHQTSTTFDQVGTSDHRFFDRNWFAVYDPSGEVALITGIGVYPNMNVMDGFVAVQHDGRQHNLRVSRRLRPAVDDLAVGPLRHSIVEPLERFRLTADEGDHGFSCDLTWEGCAPAREEARHTGFLDGRAVQDYTRFAQLGRVSGTITVGGTSFNADRWFGARDRSWGVRRGVGGFEPFTGSLPPEAAGVLLLWIAALTEDTALFLQVQEDGAGTTTYRDGAVTDLATGTSSPVLVEHHDLSFVPGTRALERAEVVVGTADAERKLTASRLCTAWAYVGTGYDNGFNDGKGLGAYRGDLVVEHDRYDVSHPETVVLPDGRSVTPMHREQPATVTIDGAPGIAHLPVITVGSLSRYGLA